MKKANPIWPWMKANRKLLLILAKIIVGGGLIAYVFHVMLKQWGGVSGAITHAFNTHPEYLALGLLAFVGVYILGNTRWILLLWPHGVHLSFWPASKPWFIGHFFAQYMPGGIAGGDVIKSYYVATHRKALGRRAEAVSTVFLDRFLGITGLISVLLIATVINLGRSAEYQSYWLWALALLIAAGLVVVLLFNKPLVKKIPFMMRLYTRLPYRDHLTRIYDAFHFYRTCPTELVVAWALSLLVHTTTALEAYLFGSALGLRYTFTEYLLLLSLANFLASIPVSPVGNFGTLEAACMALFGKVEGLPLAILIRLAYLAWGIPGLLLYVTHRKELPHEPAKETAEVIEHNGLSSRPPQIEEVPAND